MLITDNAYFAFVRRWYWLLALGLIVGLGSARYSVSQWQPLYSASATVQVGSAYQDRNPQPLELQLTDQLLPIYADLARRDQVLTEAARALGLPPSAGSLRSRLLVTTTPRIPLIDITIVDSNPQRAAAIANEIARQLVLQGPNGAEESSETQAFIKSQADDLQRKISQAQSAIAQINGEIEKLTSATEIQDARQRLAAYQTQVEGWQESYSRLVMTLEPSKINTVTVVSQARPSSQPIPRSTRLYYGLGAVMGLGLAALLGIALQLLSRSIQKPEELAAIGHAVPVLAVPRYRVPQVGGGIVATAPETEAAVAYRVLRNTLQAGGLQRTGMRLAVTSSRLAEGKTTTAANLGLALANTGYRVILVDANPRHPDLGVRFQTESYPGFSDLLLGDSDLADVLQSTVHPNVSVISAGSLATGYTDLLMQRTVETVLDDISKAADIAIFDAPALTEEQDMLLLGKNVDEVLVVVEARRTSADEVKRCLETLQQARVAVVGIVLNKVRIGSFQLDKLPWSYEARLRARARQARQARRNLILRAPGD